MSELTITPIVEHWRHRALQIFGEIRTLESERRKPLPVSGPESPEEIDDIAIAKIRALQAELKDIKSKLLRVANTS